MVYFDFLLVLPSVKKLFVFLMNLMDCVFDSGVMCHGNSDLVNCCQALFSYVSSHLIH